MNMEKLLAKIGRTLSGKITSYKNIIIDAIHALDKMFAMYEALLKELRKRPQANHLYLKERLEIYTYCIKLLLTSQREKSPVQEAIHTNAIQQRHIIRRVSFPNAA